MDKKICIVTGSNAGIGRESVIQLLENNCHVIMACRNITRGEETYKDIMKLNADFSLELKIVDMGELNSVRAFAKSINEKYDKVDVLIHNAAVFNITQKEPILTKEGIENIWAINHIGPILLTHLLMDLLKKSKQGRIITISSQGLLAKPMLKVDLVDPEFKNRKFSIVNAYYQSKRAQVMYTYWLAKKLEDSNITVNSIRVTAVQIDISRHPELSSFMKWVYKQKAKKSLTTAQMAKTYTYLSISDEVNNISGKYFNEKNNVVDSNKYTHNLENIDKVMNLSLSYIDELK
ncbi:MAG: SDR family NAD(P)-dependent oxidoreductase [Spirochaetaceae bacterium]